MAFKDVDLARLLVALAVLLLAAHGFGALFARFRQPPAIGEILGGLVLGPTVLGVVSPAVEHWIFPKTGSSAAALGAVYQIGLLLLMFAAGAEMRRLLQRNAARTIGLIASFGLVVPFAAGLGLVAALGVGSFIGTAGNKTAVVLVFGMAVAVTSIPVISRIMHDAGLLGTRFSRIVLSVAVIEDIVLYIVLAVAVGLVQPGGSAAFGVPSALNLHGVTQNAVYHTLIAVLFLGLAFTVGGRIYRALAGLRANPLRSGIRSPSSCCGCCCCLRRHWRSGSCRSTVPLSRGLPSRSPRMTKSSPKVKLSRVSHSNFSFRFILPSSGCSST